MQLIPKHFLFLIVFSAAFACQLLHAAPLKTLSLDFKRELTENGKTERTAGTLHYDAETARVVVDVTEPIQQVMIVKDRTLEIYYPVEQQAFRFTFEGRVPLPFIESILQSTQAEYGLAAVGYSLEKHDIVESVLYTYWNPPEKAKTSLGPIILGTQDDRLISAEIKDPKGRIIARSNYQHHERIGASYVPMVVTSMSYRNTAEVLQHEHIVYSNPRLNVDPPDQRLRFVIPESVAVKEVK